jgi:hypothetical protein
VTRYEVVVRITTDVVLEVDAASPEDARAAAIWDAGEDGCGVVELHSVRVVRGPVEVDS